MKQVTVSKNELIEKLNVNRTIHVEDYKAAHKVWVDLAKEYHQKQLNYLNEYGQEDRDLRKDPEPQSYEEDYSLAIQMLNMSVDDKIVLTDTQFKQYVLDDWHWAASFKNSVTTYTGKIY